MRDLLHVEKQLSQQSGRETVGKPAARCAVMCIGGADPEPRQSRRCNGSDGPMQAIEQIYDRRVAAEAGCDERSAHDHARGQQHLQRNAARVSVCRS